MKRSSAAPVWLIGLPDVEFLYFVAVTLWMMFGNRRLVMGGMPIVLQAITSISTSHLTLECEIW